VGCVCWVCVCAGPKGGDGGGSSEEWDTASEEVREGGWGRGAACGIVGMAMADSC
jgi:hypothetical protein